MSARPAPSRGGPRRGRRAAVLALLVAAATPAAGADRWTRLGDAAAWTRHCRIGDETRVGAACDGPGVARLDVALPPLEDGMRVEMAAALRPGGDAPGPARLRAWLAGADGRPLATLWERTLDPATAGDAGWQSTIVPVPDAGTEARTLVLEAAAGDRDAPAAVAWARPVLRRRAAEPVVPGVTVVVMDGLRPDRVLGGDEPRKTPILGRIARAGIVFTRAWSPTPEPASSHRALLTGRHACEQSGSDETVAARLQAAGWATAVLGDDASLAEAPGFDRAWTLGAGGFAAAAGIADRWLGEIGSVPFYLVVQSGELGRPDLLPPTARARAGIGPTAPRAEGERARYDASVAWMDQALGGLLGALGRHRLVGRAPLVLTATVGFALGEHRAFGMGRSLHAEALHVPLVVHHPASGRPRQVPDPVELRDLPRTILELAGVAADPAMPGESLVPAMRGEMPTARYVVGERLEPARATALRTARFSWLLRGDRLSLYDLAADPTERKDVAGERPAVAAEGRGRIDEFRAHCTPGRARPTRTAPIAVSPRTGPVLTGPDG